MVRLGGVRSAPVHVGREGDEESLLATLQVERGSRALLEKRSEAEAGSAAGQLNGSMVQGTWHVVVGAVGSAGVHLIIGRRGLIRRPEQGANHDQEQHQREVAAEQTRYAQR